MATRDLTEQNPLSRIWDIVEKARVGMLTMQFGGGFRARPLHARPDSDAGIIWFITDVRGAKDDEIGATHDVGLVFVDTRDRVYLSVTTRLVDTVTIPTLFKTVASNKIDLKLLITHHFKLDNILKAYETFANAAKTKALKVIIEV